jgi:hypothetical protein
LEELVEVRVSRKVRTLRGSAYDVAPSAARLTESLRDIGYDLPTAIADLVDNSIAAGSTDVRIDFRYDGAASTITVSDDGGGMSANGILEALRFGSRRSYELSDLGRFGLGLKTASLSQCRRLTVSSRLRDKGLGVVSTRTLDLDIIAEFDQWLIVEEAPTSVVGDAVAQLENSPGGTSVVLEKLFRVLPEATADTGWGRRRLNSAAHKTSEHLAIVFHRYLDGLADGRRISISVNGVKVKGWDPFARDEQQTEELPVTTLEIERAGSTREVQLRRFVLPVRSAFSSPEAFESLSGPLKWNRQQGLYIYRADRLVQYGGWNGIRAIDEHTKLARASVDFSTELDEDFQINVSKMSIVIPPDIRPILEEPIHDLCIKASDRYRRAGEGREVRGAGPMKRGPADLGDVGIALRAAAFENGTLKELEAVFAILEKRSPDVHRALAIEPVGPLAI